MLPALSKSAVVQGNANHAKPLSNHAQPPKAELRGAQVGIHSTALSKMWVRGFCTTGCQGEIPLFVPGQRKMQVATKSITSIWILQETEGQEMSNLVPWGWTRPKETLPVHSH